MRSQYGDVFSFDKLLNIFFYTSNADKLVQAKLIFMRSGYQLRHYRSRNEPYEEEYSLGTHGLLARALKQVSQTFDIRSMFFVEDTSMRLEAFSSHEDYPGTKVKEWFSATSFGDLSRQIQLRGGNRRAIVKSDIALRIPTLSRSIYFHGETVGVVAHDAPNFPPSIPYPWLTPNTFNGWFIPDGAAKPLGELEFEDSLKYDFRVKAFSALIDRIEELNAALNFGARNSAVRRRFSPSADTGQLPLFSEVHGRLFLVIGNKCAGKSTFSDYIAGRLNEVFAIEASTLLRNLALADSVPIIDSSSALEYLKVKGLDAVAREATVCLVREGANLSIISGFRTVEELLYVKKYFPAAEIILVEADQRTRFERHIKRARDSEARTFKEFQHVDEEQATFGALRVAQEIADVTLRNEDDMNQYHRRIDELVATKKVRTRIFDDSELFRSLRALAKIGHAATCDEIATVTEQQGRLVRKYNNNRALKGVPEFASRIERTGSLLKYRLNSRGSSLLHLLEFQRQSSQNA